MNDNRIKLVMQAIDHCIIVFQSSDETGNDLCWVVLDSFAGPDFRDAVRFVGRKHEDGDDLSTPPGDVYWKHKEFRARAAIQAMVDYDPNDGVLLHMTWPNPKRASESIDTVNPFDDFMSGYEREDVLSPTFRRRLRFAHREGLLPGILAEAGLPEFKRADGAGVIDGSFPNDNRIKAALLKLFDVVNEEWDRWAAQPENQRAAFFAKRLCAVQQGGRSDEIAAGHPADAAFRCGKAFGILHPIEPVWAHYLPEARRAIAIFKELDEDG